MNVRRLLVSAAALPLTGCSPFHHGFLAAAGPVAEHERHLFLIVCIVMLFVIGPVILLTPLFAWHYRLANTKSAYRPRWSFSWTLEGLIWIPPSLIVVGLAFLLWRDTHALDPYKPIPSDLPSTEVQAIALDWKWLFIYPDQHIATVNELVFPADRPVHLKLTSGTVMQSLMLPRLAGQIYAMAGMTTQLNIAADRPGTYEGENTQFNGEGFQRQHFQVLALSSANYDQWLMRAKAQSATLDMKDYDRLAGRFTVDHPEIYGSVAPDLFQSVLDKDKAGAHAAVMKDHP
jgi:cytochrome o ubiquinol oxidase subunit 2